VERVFEEREEPKNSVRKNRLQKERSDIYGGFRPRRGRGTREKLTAILRTSGGGTSQARFQRVPHKRGGGHLLKKAYLGETAPPRKEKISIREVCQRKQVNTSGLWRKGVAPGIRERPGGNGKRHEIKVFAGDPAHVRKGTTVELRKRKGGSGRGGKSRGRKKKKGPGKKQTKVCKGPSSKR